MKMTMAGAIRRTLKEEMQKDERIFLMGEDIGIYGGIFKATLGLQQEFGENRVIDSPLCEVGIIGAAIGAAVAGMRPVVEIMYSDFLPLGFDQLVNNAAKIHYLSRGEVSVPLVIRMNYGASGKGAGAQHSQTPEGWLMNIPGIKVVLPSSASDARGLLQSAIADNNTVLFLEHKQLYQASGEIDESGPIPLGKAVVKRPGKDITVVATSLMLVRALQAAEQLAEDGVDAEVIDLRTIRPFDREAVAQSVKKTGRLLTVEENPELGGWGAHVVTAAVQDAMSALKCPPQRLAEPDVPMPAFIELEQQVVPSKEAIVQCIKSML